MRWQPVLDPTKTPHTPLFLAIARAVSSDVQRGRLRPGDLLPGSRTLAETLGCNRNTVLAAYRELHAEGWIETRGAGTFVAADLPTRHARSAAPGTPRRSGVPARAAFVVPTSVERFAAWNPLPVEGLRKGMFVLSSGQPDPRHVPVEALARAYRRALRGPQGRALLSYGDARGHASLRTSVAQMLSSLRGLAAGPDDVLITRGSQQAIDLAARALIAPGDVVAVEQYGYPPAWAALRRAGAELVPVAVDAHGLDTDALRALAGQRRVRAVYLTPHHQYPTTVTLSAARRLSLLELARAERFAILEDDYDYELHYEGRPVLPLASADVHGSVVYVGTLSKMLAPGLRVGFVTAPRDVLERIAAFRRTSDRQGDQAMEAALAELFDDGEVARHARRMRGVYRARRDALLDALSEKLGDVLEIERPPGGMALWARVRGVSVDAWCERALERGVAFAGARVFRFDGHAAPFARFGFALHDERELRTAVSRLREALTRAK